MPTGQRTELRTGIIQEKFRDSWSKNRSMNGQSPLFLNDASSQCTTLYNLALGALAPIA
jgi:hypothetical protein